MPKISQEPQDTAPTLTDYVVTVDTESGQTKKVLLSDLSNIVAARANLFINPYKFSVYRNAALTLTGGSATTVFPYDTKTFDTSTNVDVVTNKGRFTAPIAGFYWFNMSFIYSATTGDHVYLGFFKNGVEGQRVMENNAASTSNNTVAGSGFLQLAANDYVEPYYNISTARAIITGSAYNYFNGFLVSAT